MGWSKEWPGLPGDTSKISEALAKIVNDGWVVPTDPNVENGKIKQEITSTKEMYNNLKPTHDPYTNPGAMVYYECACGAILDPKTKSFAHLNNAASVAGWKIRWKHDGMGYQPFCVKCGEGVE